MVSMGLYLYYTGNINPLSESVSIRTSSNLNLESRMGFIRHYRSTFHLFQSDFKPKLRMVLSVSICNIHGEQWFLWECTCII